MPKPKRGHVRLRRSNVLERAGGRSETIIDVPAGMVLLDDPDSFVVNVIPARPLDIEPLYGVG